MVVDWQKPNNSTWYIFRDDTINFIPPGAEGVYVIFTNYNNIPIAHYVGGGQIKNRLREYTLYNPMRTRRKFTGSLWVTWAIIPNTIDLRNAEAFIKQKEYIKQAAKSHTKEQLEEKINSLHSFTTLIKDFSNHFMFCSCWFRKEHESFIMWGEYGDKRHPASIALQTTIGDLIDSFVEYDADYDVHIGKVKYKDYRNEHIEGYECFEKENLNEPENVLKLFYAPILHKKRVFDDEHEVRATISFESICKHHLEDAIDISNIPFYSDRMFAADSRYFSSDTTNLMADVPPYGIPIRINIRKLVKTVAISKIGWEYFQKPLVELLDNKKLSPKIIISDI